MTFLPNNKLGFILTPWVTSSCSHVIIYISSLFSNQQCGLNSYLCCSSLWSEPGIVKTSSCPWNKRITWPPRRYPIQQKGKLLTREGTHSSSGLLYKLDMNTNFQWLHRIRLSIPIKSTEITPILPNHLHVATFVHLLFVFAHWDFSFN